MKTISGLLFAIASRVGTDALQTAQGFVAWISHWP
jgi:hypothetical protein